ncbi:helix-turn-helix domain-containing protein [Roseiflexus sp. AH-315-K22]|nr:helix-turn-helix domain-containing protein [Roseiflexus sp. AH-315-K22]
MRKPPTESARPLTGDTGGTLDTSDLTQLLIDPKQAASRLSLGTRTLWSLTACRAIPSHKIGKKSVRYSVRELEQWVALGCPTEPGSADRVRKGVNHGR